MARDPSVPRAPAGAPRHRRWRVWYDPGEGNGSAIRETKWRGGSPAGETIEAKAYDDILAAIDEIEDALGHDRGERMPFIDARPGAPRGPWNFWAPDERGKSPPVPK